MDIVNTHGGDNVQFVGRIAETVRVRTLQPGVRAVLVTEGFLEQIASEASRDGRRVTWEWGEPDADGFYTPTFTEHRED